MTIFFKQAIIISIAVFCIAGCSNPDVIYAERKKLTETVYASGKLIPDSEIRVTSLCNGTIIKKLVKDGDEVKSGDLLYLIRNDAAREGYAAALKSYEVANINLSGNSPLLNDLKLQLHNARLQCINDSTVYFRYLNLWQQGIGTRNNLDNVFTKYEISRNQEKMARERLLTTINELQVSQGNARSQLSAAAKALDDYSIRSDRDGIVFQTLKEEGESVMIHETVALLGKRYNQLVRLSVDQQDINKIRTGQRVLIKTDLTGDSIFEASVFRIYPAMNEQDRTFRVDAGFEAAQPPSFIHSSVEANIIVQQKEHALVLPRSALTGADSIWIYAGRRKQKRAIRTGISSLEYVEVLAGIDEKTAIVPNK